MRPTQLADKTGSTRPRIADERATEILDATVSLLARIGYDRLTMDQVAAEAHASKASLYRHWSSKAELVVDAVSQAKGLPESPPDTGTLRGDLRAAWCGGHQDANQSLPVSVMSGLMSAMHADEELATVFRKRFLEPRWVEWRKLAERARDRGEIAESVDLDLVLALMPALCSYFGVVRGCPVDETLVDRIIDEVVLPVAQHTPHEHGSGDAVS